MERRNNVITRMTVPQYANVTMYAEGCHLTVTFPIKYSVREYVKSSNTMYNIHCFSKNNRNYITAEVFIPYNKVVEAKTNMESAIYHYSQVMCNLLKITARKAKIAAINEEIVQLTLPF